jgi:hypothetical protein
MFGRAPSGLAHEPGGVRIVHHHQRLVTVGQVADAVQGRDVAVHGEHPVRHDEAEARGRGLPELVLEVPHVRVLVDEAFGLAEADAVDDGRVVEAVGEDGIFRAEERLEHPAVGVEAGRVRDRVVHPEEVRDPALEVEVQALRAADEAHARHPIAPGVQGAVRRGHQLRMAGQAEVVVGAEVQDPLRAPLHPDLGALRADDRPLFAQQPLLAHRLELARRRLCESWVHASRLLRGF